MDGTMQLRTHPIYFLSNDGEEKELYMIVTPMVEDLQVAGAGELSTSC